VPKSKAEKLRDRFKALLALMGSSNVNEREVARLKIDELLAKNKRNWNDLTELMSGGRAEGWQDDEPAVADPGISSGGVQVNPLDLIREVLRRHLYLDGEEQYVAITLWIAHTFVYSRVSFTPRLALVSPVRGCGKTTVLNIIKSLAFRTVKTDHVTPAVLFRRIDRDRPTLLIDEADNQDLPTNATLRTVLNSGHHRDGKIERYLDGRIQSFSTFAPIAIAAIGKLPMPLMHRSIVIKMERSPEMLERFDPMGNADQDQLCAIVYRETLAWARQVKLNQDPAMPEGLRNRLADNWRILVSIGDACSAAWGKLARDAGIALSNGRDEDLGVLLLSDIRDIFDRRKVDRLSSAVIIADLIDVAHGLWSEWRGPRDDQTPRNLSQGELARMLAPFGIRPKSIWPPRRGGRDKSAKGYQRAQFEAAWASYCGGTPAQRNNVSYFGLAGGAL
jgi:Protein of unknown function (DUF3631)